MVVLAQMDVVLFEQDQVELQIWEGESAVCRAPASSGRGAGGQGRGTPAPFGLRGPVPARSRALPAGAELRDRPGGGRFPITEGHNERLRGLRRARTDCIFIH